MDSDDSDKIYDEIDRHHMSLDVCDINRKDSVIHKQAEVLNVEGDSSDDGYDDNDGDYDDEQDRNSFSDSDNDGPYSIEKFLPSADKWGSGRKSFYNTSYVDEDWGGMNEKEAELAELEEEDAVARQKKLDAALDLLPLQFQDEIQEEKIGYDSSETPNLESMTAEQRHEYFLKINLDMKQILNEYQSKRKYFLTDVLPLLDLAYALQHFRPDLVLEKQLILAVNTFSRYLTNLLFAFYIKIGGDSCQGTPQFIDHPVLQGLSTFQNEVFFVTNFLEKYGVLLRRMSENLKSKDFKNMLALFPTTEFVRKSKVSTSERHKKLLIDEDGIDRELQLVNDEMEEEIMKRSITNQIQKNKGLQNKRKKGTQHSRIKKRKQFKKALIKKHSQKADAKKELTPYGGETRGIRASTVKSVKLKA